MPIKTWDTSGTVLFDSDAITNGVCLGAYLVPAGVGFYKAFPLLAGATVRVMPINGNNSISNFSVTYPGSVPIVQAAAAAYNQYIVLWANGTPSIQSGAGMQAVGSNGTVALSPNARGCVYVGAATHVSTTGSTGSPFNGGRLGWATFNVYNCPNPPVLALAVNGSYYVRISEGPVYLGNNTWTFDAQCIPTTPTTGGGSWPALAVPTILVYAQPTAPSNGAVAALYDSDGTLAYDLLMGRILTSNGTLFFPPSTGADSYGINLPAGVPTNLCAFFGVPLYLEIRSLQRNATTWQQSRYAGFFILQSGQLVRQRVIVETTMDADPLTRFIEAGGYVEIVTTGL